MARANAAYYGRRDPFADFTTAPEIGQVFGELLGAWAAVTWQAMGAPDPVALVEAGPGRGTLMQDARRATARVAPAFHAACSIHFIETSLRLRAEQAARVPDATWHEGLDSLPDCPTMLLANEFLDALPIRQFVRLETGWTERHVQDGRFVELAISDAPQDGVLAMKARPGMVREVSEAGLAWIRALARRLSRHLGVALLLDYGPAQSGPGDSLQAIRDGRPADPLADPGEADLTAHVDFQALAQAAARTGAVCHGPVPQGDFLGALGLHARTARLIEANPQRAAALREAAARLAAPDRMGALFKALCLTHPGCPVPAGFAG